MEVAVLITGVSAAWSWPRSHPACIDDRMVTKFDEVRKCVEGYCAC